MPMTMQLPVQLQDADRLRISEALTAQITEQEQVEAAKREAVRGWNVTLKEKKKRVHDLNESLRTGTELREVEVEERPDYAAGIVFVHRLDTGDCVQQRAIDPDERQVKMGLEGPKVLDGGLVDEAARTDEQREATTPEEAEVLRAERLAQERAERIAAGVQEARERITVVSEGEGDRAWKAALQFGNRFLEAEAATAADSANGIAQQVTEILEAEEDSKLTLADAVAASAAEQARQEVERLAAEQAADDAQTKKRTLKVGAGDGLKNGGLRAPKKRKTKHETTMPDGRVVDPEEEAEKLEAGDQQTPGDDGPVATGREGDDVPVDENGQPVAF